MKASFNFNERLMLTMIIPQQGNMIEMAFAEELSEQIKLTADEIRITGFQMENGPDGNPIGYKWDQTKAKDKIIEIPEQSLVMLKGWIDDMDQKKNIKREMYPLCKRIKSF